MLWLELAVVLAAIFVGSRVGGLGLGTVAAVGLAVLVFVFGLPPGSALVGRAGSRAANRSVRGGEAVTQPKVSP